MDEAADNYGQRGDDNNEASRSESTHETQVSRNPLEAFVDWWKSLLPPPSQRHRLDYSPNSSPSSSLAYVTLHFDPSANCSVAVLSKPDKGLCSIYFDCRVQQGTARRHSALYYELDGFVREQYWVVKRSLQPHEVHVALGAMELSDKAHIEFLELQRKRKRNARHTVDASSYGEYLVAQVLEIARLCRLAQDLDVISLYCLAQTNRACCDVAARIYQQQRNDAWQFTITPYVDGANASGYSRLTRQDSTNLVEHYESGRTVVYQQCPKVKLLPMQKENGKHQDFACYTPVSYSSDSYLNNNSQSTFSWACEEIALAHLHQWWGDIAERDYIGQKLIVQWQPASTSQNFILDTLRLEAGPHTGTCVWKTTKQTAVTIHVMASATKAIDNVTLSYAGQARIVSLRVPWMTLVRTYAAKVEWPRLVESYATIQHTRPLLPHELNYGEIVHALATAQK